MKQGVVTPEEYEAFRQFLVDASGIVLGDNKHYLVISRLGRVMAEHAVDSLGGLVQLLKRPGNDGLRERVIEAMTTNETFWFRDGYPFELLKDLIFPELARRRVRPVRVWSAASSSGQEAYSISIAVQEFLQSSPSALPQVEVLGTDIAPQVIKEAEKAVYDDLAVSRGLTEERKRKYFERYGINWQVRPEIRQRVRFKYANLLHNYGLLGKFHIIFCRNVLIYFSLESKRDIVTRMARALHPGGYLFLGASESLSQYSDDFELVRSGRGVVYRLRDR